MGQAIWEFLPMAVALTIIPIPIVAVILMLFSERARQNGVAFLTGWILGVAAAMSILLVVVSSQDPATDEGSSATLSWIKVILGAILVLLAVREWRKRPAAGVEVEMPRWMQRIDSMEPGGAFGLGILLAAANPKNLLLIAGGAVAIAQADLPSSETAIAIAIFTLIGSLSIAIPALGYLFTGERIQPSLDRAKTWLTANNTTVMAVLLIVIGIALLGKGLGDLT